MSFITIIMASSIVFWQLTESIHKNYCPVSIQMNLTFAYVILLSRTGMVNVSNVSIETH